MRLEVECHPVRPPLASRCGPAILRDQYNRCTVGVFNFCPERMDIDNWRSPDVLQVCAFAALRRCGVACDALAVAGPTRRELKRASLSHRIVASQDMRATALHEVLHLIGLWLAQSGGGR